MFFGEMTMKKVLIAALLAGMSLSASAAQTIRFATEASYPPFELVDANNQIVGFDVDLANALCKEIDATCTFTNQAFDSLIPGLKFRRFDAVMAGMDITPEREKQVLFSTPYYDNSALFVGQQGKFTSIDQLKGKKVGVQNGTTHQKFITDKHPEIHYRALRQLPECEAGPAERSYRRGLWRHRRGDRMAEEQSEAGGRGR